MAVNTLRPTPAGTVPAVYALLPVILSGTVKAAGIQSIGPAGAPTVDLTFLAVAMLLIAAALDAFSRKSERINFRPLFPALAFFLVALVAVAWSVPGEYQTQKFRDMFLVTLPIVLTLPILLRSRSDLKHLVIVWIAAGWVATSLVYLVPESERLGGRFGVGDTTLGPAYLIAMAVAATVASFGTILSSALALVSLAPMVPTLIAVGSRGPIVALVASTTSVFLMKARWRTLLLAAPVIFLGAFIGLRISSEDALDRFVVYDFNRSYVFSMTMELVRDRLPGGAGWGNFTGLLPAFDYPHNLVLETGYELGILGLLSLGILVVAAARSSWRARGEAEARALAGVGIVALVGQMFSFDLTYRTFWIAIVSCLLLSDRMTSGNRDQTVSTAKPLRTEV